MTEAATQDRESTGETVLATVSAEAAATAWLNSFLASSTDDTRAILYRTLSIESFDDGIQIIGCDGTALFRTWVPDVEKDTAPWPILAEVPNETIVVMDPDGFGFGFMRALARVMKDDTHAGEKLTLSISENDASATLSLGEAFMTKRLTLRALGQRIDLQLFDGQYPDWRNARLGIDRTELVEGMTIAPRILSLVGRLKSVSSVALEFYGETKHVAFTARGLAEVRGLLMPMQRQDQAME